MPVRMATRCGNPGAVERDSDCELVDAALDEAEDTAIRNG
jgi:hypothetical protein